jgi:hypothetical protein
VNGCAESKQGIKVLGDPEDFYVGAEAPLFHGGGGIVEFFTQPVQPRLHGPNSHFFPSRIDL